MRLNKWRIGDSNAICEKIACVTSCVDSDTAKNNSGAKTGAVGATDPRLSTIIAAWPSLTEAEQDALLEQAIENSTG